MLKDNVSFLILYHCHRLLPREQEKEEKKKKSLERWPWEGDKYFNRSHSRNPQMTYMQIALKQLGVAEDAHSVLQGLQTDLRPAQKEVFKLSISYPNYLLLLIN